MPTTLLLDKSYLDGAPTRSIHKLCQDYSVVCSETLFFELMTTRNKSQVRCFSKLPSHPGAFSLLPNVGTLLRAEMETQAPCGPIERHLIEGSYRFNPKLRTGTYFAEGKVLENLLSWRAEIDEKAKAFLDRCQSIHEFFPELIGIEFRDFPASVATVRTKVATNPEFVRAVYASFSRDDLPPKAPAPEDISCDWAWFRWVQCQLLGSLRIFERYQCNVPTITYGVLERAEHSMHDMDYVILGSLIGTIASNDNEIIEDFQLVNPGGKLITTREYRVIATYPDALHTQSKAPS